MKKELVISAYKEPDKLVIKTVHYRTVLETENMPVVRSVVTLDMNAPEVIAALNSLGWEKMEEKNDN